jgi:hypothetical protein
MSASRRTRAYCISDATPLEVGGIANWRSISASRSSKLVRSTANFWESTAVELTCSSASQTTTANVAGTVQAQYERSAAAISTEALMAAVGTAEGASVDSAGPIQSNASATAGVMNRVSDADTCRSPDIRCCDT